MGLTVIVNSMTVSHKGSDGLSIAFPDVCKTPVLGVPVPIPYPNIAMSSDLTKGSKKVKCDEKKVVLKSSKIKRSMGDEVGVQMGIISNKQMGKGKFANYSFDVKFEGKNVCRLLDPTTQNRSSLNTAAFAHLQAPKSASGPNAELIEGACEEVKKKKKEQQSSDPKVHAGPKKSGITTRHWHGMRKYLDKATPSFLIYFRSSGEHVAQWIDKNCHEPKPHEWLDGLSMKPARLDDFSGPMRMWLQKHQDSEEFIKMLAGGMLVVVPNTGVLGKMGLADDIVQAVDCSELDGVIISKRAAYGEGRPIVGRKQWNKLDFRHQWMTGDYDMMDIIKEKEVCTRPSSEEYGKLKFELNQAMGWPGIQHGPQATWNTAGDKDYKGESFSVAQKISDWLRDGATAAKDVSNMPLGVNAADLKNDSAKDVKGAVVIDDDGNVKRSMALIDDDLTILGPGGGLHLKDASDYWDALACCGCIDPDVKPNTEHLEESKGWKEKSAKLENKPWKGEGDEKRRWWRRNG
ncbi:MAG: hypothetical protein DRI90_18480 [Deltaproteobacteria bacterium]|nr:MAG: hypothetical protein DRI90_18480 [Deltaproteobacteria bacterium]